MAVFPRNAGPDFHHAKIKIGDTLWVGSIEIHQKSSDWFQHGHHEDVHYNNVILHVVQTADKDVITEDGKCLPQLVLTIPEHLKENYKELCKTTDYPRCHKIIPQIDHFTIHSWLNALVYERLEQKAHVILERVKSLQGDWEKAYFITLARNFGFGINGDAFEFWAKNIPLPAVAHHRDNLFQIEAIFMGQAGLLDINTIPQKYQQEAVNDGYFSKLKGEYEYRGPLWNRRIVTGINPQTRPLGPHLLEDTLWPEGASVPCFFGVESVLHFKQFCSDHIAACFVFPFKPNLAKTQPLMFPWASCQYPLTPLGDALVPFKTPSLK